MTTSKSRRPRPGPRADLVKRTTTAPAETTQPRISAVAMIDEERAMALHEPTGLTIQTDFPETDLSEDFIKLALSEAMRFEFTKTPAGYISMKSRLERLKNNKIGLVVDILHWRSFTHPEKDERITVTLEISDITRTTKTD